MTEKDLYKYIKAKRTVKRLEEDLRLIYGTMGTPSAPNISPVPSDHSGDVTDRLAFEIDEANRIRSRLDEARRECAIAALRLDDLEKRLDKEEEIKLLDYLYRKGLKIKDAARKLGYSASRTYAFRYSILAVAKTMNG